MLVLAHDAEREALEPDQTNMATRASLAARLKGQRLGLTLNPVISKKVPWSCRVPATGGACSVFMPPW